MITCLLIQAGRLQIDEQLMNELANIKDLVHPDEILLVIDAMTGQNAVNTAEGFNDKLDVTGVVLTKFDGEDSWWGCTINSGRHW